VEKLFLITVGTSLITGTGLLTSDESKTVMDESLAQTRSAEKEAILQKLTDKLRVDHEAIFRTAEFSTLRAYQRTVNPDAPTWYNPGARYVFIGTDTSINRYVLRTFRSILSRHFATIQLEADIIVPGLTVGVAAAYDTAQHELYQSLKMVTLPYMNQQQPQNVIICATGGFKFVSGWMHTYATIHGFGIMYIHEASRELLLTRPRIALDFPTPLHV
jgi:putative CRISPR-associated protein (TIGR02619 family)